MGGRVKVREFVGESDVKIFLKNYLINGKKYLIENIYIIKNSIIESQL